MSYSSVPILIAAFLLVAIVESSAYVRLPLGLLLAIALLASDADLLPIALIGAGAVTVARLTLAIRARRGRDNGANPRHGAHRDALRAQLAASPAYARTTFILGALPGVPANVIFPLLGSMRAPLTPVVVGTLVGRTPMLALTTAFFVWVGRFGDGGDDAATILLGIFATGLLIIRTVGLIDWQHRAEHGGWRFRDPDSSAVRMMSSITGASARGGRNAHVDQRSPWSTPSDDDDVVEGELLGENVDEDDDAAPPPGLPPTGLAPS